jgi:hypothetical protein
MIQSRPATTHRSASFSSLADMQTPHPRSHFHLPVGTAWTCQWPLPADTRTPHARPACQPSPLLFLGEQSVPVFVQDTETLLQTTHIQKVNYAASAQYSVKWIHTQKMHMYKVQVPCQLVGPTIRDENGTDIFRPYSRPNLFRGV